MKTISDLEQLKENIEMFNSYSSGSKEKQKWYSDRIKKGTCFIPSLINGTLTFSPSRFVGYVNNTIRKHKKNKTDGKITNPIISSILESKPVVNETMEKKYLKFCTLRKITPNEKGSFGVPRKYWITSAISKILIDGMCEDIEQDENIDNTVKKQLIDARIGQGKFRDDLINMWKSKCAFTEIDCLSILKASHIKPWKDSNNRERLDKYNGLLLMPNADALFDKGLISFTNSGELLVSKSIDRNTVEYLLGRSIDQRIKCKKRHLFYLDYHRRYIFKRRPNKRCS
jgi:putative restriction endonuclease